MRTLAFLMALQVIVVSCSDDPPVAPEPPDAALKAWFAERGIALPPGPLAPEATAKATSDGRILGDVTGNGTVSSWDLSILWHYLTTLKRLSEVYDMDLVDIDRDGDADWVDLMLLGDFLYGSKENPYSIGEPITETDTTKDPPPEEPPPPETTDTFNIEIVYVDSFYEQHKKLIRKAADQWESILTEGLPDVDVQFDSQTTRGWNQYSPFRPGTEIVIDNETIDDLRIYVGLRKSSTSGGLFSTAVVASGGVLVLRPRESNASPYLEEPGGLPSVGVFAIDARTLRPDSRFWKNLDLYPVALHEIAHALGMVGHRWTDELRYGYDPHFPGPRAIAAFDRAGGTQYGWAKVPIQEEGGGHWRDDVFGDELMTTKIPWDTSSLALSEITIEALGDLGYSVDATRADPYTLPPASKPVAVEADPFCEVLPLPEK